MLSNCESKDTISTTRRAVFGNERDSSSRSIWKSIPYDLNQPVIIRQLPEILNEVSGLTDIDSSHVACVQDEIGMIFIYNFITDSIVYRHKFDTFGDFEGLTYMDNSLFILRSDGRLTEWLNFNPQTGGASITHKMLPLLTSNNEGLCYDKSKNRLLIAAKGKPINHDYKSDRFIYEYDLSGKKLNPNPVFTINTMDMEMAGRKLNILPQGISGNGKPKAFNFRPSSLAVHPLTSDIFIISASDKLLIVMNEAGVITCMEPLPEELFMKAEGITFLNDGTMIITNEAAGKVPTLLIYKPEK